VRVIATDKLESYAVRRRLTWSLDGVEQSVPRTEAAHLDGDQGRRLNKVAHASYAVPRRG
jgi:hypothetical protein